MTTADQRHTEARALLGRLKAEHDVLKHFRPLHEAGVEQALIERHPGEQTWLIRAALHQHVNSESYLQALSHGGARLDLDGQGAGEVSNDERHHARALLKHHRAHHRQA